ncbi:O-acetyltransferase OatA [compost metagenome]
MLPDDAKALSLSAIASTLSAANIYFWKFLDTSYFAASSDTVPLLHMWSLGVEEQFYLIWPALLLLTLKFGGRALTVGVASVIAAACFWYGQSKLAADPTFAYYMLPSRAGELLIGGMTFFLTEAIKGRVGQRTAQAMALVGALVLAWSLASIRETEGFPGFISIVPAIGASLVLAAGSFGKTLVGNILAVRPMVSIGLVSFSLYLWHWPVLAFYRYAYGEPDMLGNLICLSVMVAMTLFSYFLIEVPFRANKGWKFTLATPASAALALSFAGVIYASNGIISPFSPSGYQESLAEKRSSSAPASSASYVCQSVFKPEYFSSEKCIAGDTSKQPSVLLIGDSNAAHYVGYLGEIAKNEGVAIRNVEHHACPPFPGQRSTKYVRDGYKVSCPAYNVEAFKQISNYDTIILGGSWTAYEAVDRAAFIADFDAMLDALSQSGKNVVIALKAPTFNSVDRQCSEKALKIPFINCEQKTVVSDNGEHRLNREIIKRVSGRANVSYFGVRDLICDGKTCSAFSGKTQLYYDGGHLSHSGSEKLGQIAIKTGAIPAPLLNLSRQSIATN